MAEPTRSTHERCGGRGARIGSLVSVRLFFEDEEFDSHAARRCEGAAPALYDQRTYDWLDWGLSR